MAYFYLENEANPPKLEDGLVYEGKLRLGMDGAKNLCNAYSTKELSQWSFKFRAVTPGGNVYSLTVTR